MLDSGRPADPDDPRPAPPAGAIIFVASGKGGSPTVAGHDG